MVQLYQNSTPNMYFTGYRDTPATGIAEVSLATPLFCPITLIRAGWGPTNDAILVASADERNRHFGESAFDMKDKYFTHTTLYSSLYLNKGVVQFLQRVKLPNATKAKCRLSIEYVEIDDALLLDGATTTDGYKVRYFVDVDDGTMEVGAGVDSAGTLTGKTGAVSVVVPLLDFEASYEGARGNNFNINIHPITGANADSASIEMYGDMQYSMAFTETPPRGGTAKAVKTKYNTESIEFCFREDALNKVDRRMGLLKTYMDNFIVRSGTHNGGSQFGVVDGMFAYDANIKRVSDLFHAAEMAAITAEIDANLVIDENLAPYIHETNTYSVNLFGSTDHAGKAYRTIKQASTVEVADVEGAYTPSSITTFSMGNGNDGDLTPEAFELACGDIFDAFGGDVTWHDHKRYPFHFIIDSGFSSDVKKKMQSIMGKRVDVAPLIGTHVDGAKPLSLIDENAMVGMLAANVAQYAESTVFSTESCRSIILPWVIEIDSTHPLAGYGKPVSLMFDLVEKICEYIGSSTAIWNTLRSIDENNVIQHRLLNFQYAELPVREEMWKTQAVAVESSDHAKYIYSGLQTVHPNESSILNSLISIFGTIHATWACIQAFGKFVGRKMPPGRLVNDSNEYIASLVAGVDQSKVTITPDTQFTAEDTASKYAWTTQAHVQSDGMYTVNTIQINSSYYEGA